MCPSNLKERLIISLVLDGTLSIDEFGRVWRHFKLRTRSPHERFSIPAKRAESYDDKGYLNLRVTINSHPVRCKAHRLVWQHFFGDIPNRTLEINHRNGIRDDNKPSNLEIVSHSRNIMHAFRVTGNRTMVGEDHSQAKLTESDVRWIKERIAAGTHTGVALARMFNVHSNTIYGIKHGKKWRHVG